MADTKITENDEDELIPVETPLEEGEQADDADGVEDEDEEDERLSQSDDDHEEDVARQTTHDRRTKRRERQKRAKEAAQRELDMLRRTVAELTQRVSVTENHALQTNAQTLEQRLARAQYEVQQAEGIIAKATEAGNGEDVVTAMRIRDQAIAEAQQLAAAKQQFDQARAQQSQPHVDPVVVNYAKQWIDANPWYDPQGRDRDSALTKAIDTELTRAGYNPKTREYWEELTSRVTDALASTDTASKPRRKAPPTGNTREHAPASTKKEIYVTPERKQAMIEAGVWDDPVRRQSMLRAYQAYDTGSAR